MSEYKDISAFELSEQYSSRVIHDDQFQAPYRGDLKPDAITFGSIVTGSQSADVTATLTNMGFRPLPVEEIKISGDFLYSTDCPVGGELGVGKTCSIVLNFNPSSAGLKQGGLYVNTGDAQGAEFVGLLGYGVASGKGVAGLSASSLSFGSVDVGVSSDTKTVTLVNNGDVDLAVKTLTVSGEFSLTSSPAVPTTLVSGASMVISVKMTPISAGAKSGTVSIGHDGSGSTSIALSGTGVAAGTTPVMSISDAIIEAYQNQATVTSSVTALAFDTTETGHSSVAKSVLLTNSGLLDATITGVTLSNTTDFSLSSDSATVGDAVPASGTALLRVLFNPSAGGARTATLTVTTDATSGSSFIIPLSGTGEVVSTDLARLAISGNQFVLASDPSSTVRLKSINWFGAEGTNYTPHGTWLRPWKAILDDIKAMGFNCVRFPFSGDTCTVGRTPPTTAIDEVANPDLVGLNSLEILDLYFDYCNTIGLYVVLDHHRRTAGDGADGSPVDSSYTEAQWHADWLVMANRYKAHPAVVGADLHNEPHDLTWSQWATYVESCANAIIAVAPLWLYFVEGVGTNSDSTSTWWGGALKDVATRPIVLSVASKVAYSPHEYGQSTGSQSWLSTDSNAVSGYPNNLYAVWDANWGFIYKNNLAPIWIGEFGGKFGVDGSGNATQANGTVEAQWVTNLAKYLNGDFNGDGTSDIATTKKGMSFAFWAYNPNSSDTGGLVEDDWTTHQAVKVSLLAPLLT
jgi:aryl-phospho-beta-D-glucosidase BglC (GH1 family)